MSVPTPRNSNSLQPPTKGLAPIELQLLAWIRGLVANKRGKVLDILTDAVEMIEEGFSDSEIVHYIKRNYPFWD
jgi:hypothetical protein